jgi:hypothetical protein
VQYRRLLTDLETAVRPDRQAVITARLQLASARTSKPLSGADIILPAKNGREPDRSD